MGKALEALLEGVLVALESTTVDDWPLQVRLTVARTAREIEAKVRPTGRR
ncbi:hypothetical protein AB0G74_08680 [Streptomyces sp. NPDC020875]